VQCIWGFPLTEYELGRMALRAELIRLWGEAAALDRAAGVWPPKSRRSNPHWALYAAAFDEYHGDGARDCDWIATWDHQWAHGRRRVRKSPNEERGDD